MAQRIFKDGAGRNWPITLNVGIMREAREKLAIDFTKWQDGSLFDKLSDRESLVNVAWLFVRQAAEKQSVTEEQFVSSMSQGPDIDTATEAIVQAWIDFQSSRLQPLLRETWAKINGIQNTAASKGLAIIQGQTNEELIAKIASNATQQLATTAAVAAKVMGEAIVDASAAAVEATKAAGVPDPTPVA